MTDMASNAGDAVLVRSVIDLGHNLGLTVVAEGVEEGCTRDALRALGCDVAQGYLFARPRPADELTEWLHDAACVAARQSPRRRSATRLP